MITDAQMRSIALELPEVKESSHFGHPDFRVKKRIFATLWPDRHRSVLKLPKEEQAALVSARPDVFSIPAGGERGGWTNVNLALVDDEQLRQLMRMAWEVLPRPRARKELARKRVAGGAL